MTRGGASARRIKIAAKETDSTPKNRVKYGFTDYYLPINYLPGKTPQALGYDKPFNLASSVSLGLSILLKNLGSWNMLR